MQSPLRDAEQTRDGRHRIAAFEDRRDGELLQRGEGTPLQRTGTQVRERARSVVRRTRAERIVQRLNELGVRIALPAVLDQAAGGAIGRPHIARAMIAEGWAVDFRDAFDRYLGNGKAAFVPKDRLPVSEAIQLIHRAGGLAVLAHPGSAGTRERVEAFVGQGIDGLEVRHPSHTPEDVARLSALVEHFGLVPSGGSDWHGSGDGPRTLGAMRVPGEWLNRQDGRVRARAA